MRKIRLNSYQLLCDKKQLARKWFEFRAVAESIKSLAWQYAVGCGDFCDESAANKLFLKQIKEIKERCEIIPYPKTISSKGIDEIKDTMEIITKMEWEEKKETYIKERINDQIAWYTNKSKWNKNHSYISDVCIITLQFIATVACIYLLYNHVNGAPILALIATIITSIIGWSKSKQYAELVEPYLNTARELSEIRQEMELAKEETEFRSLVLNAEQAISREHTMWLVNRGLFNQWHKLE
ncbi:DUF4231 domain-containing protein [Methanolobus sp. WCC5]|uniref:DUF4231 domain-containing protein n=1 Tax=Methanolobus sp. WCC5 TaxID=3125785 RepID=UPI0032566C24